jgi:hypothetical protein
MKDNINCNSYVLSVTPEMASDWLRSRPYSGQRNISPRRVEEYLYYLKNDLWRLGSLDFHHVSSPPCVVGSNGQHRLTAVSRHTSPAPFIVHDHYVETMQEVQLDYESYDNPGASRKLLDVLPGSGLVEDTGVARSSLNRASNALGLVDTKFCVVAAVANKIALRSHHAKIKRLELWKEEVVLYYSLLLGSTATVRQLMETRPVMGVALVTLKHSRSREKAERFWERMAANDGLERRDPAHVMLDILLRPAYAGKNDPAYISRVVATAWNAEFEGRDIGYIRVMDRNAPILIRGTSFTGK